MISTAKQVTFVVAYLRYSSDGQADGNSFERQRLAVQSHLKKWNLGPETPIEWLEDPGLSAFSGKHMKSGQLGNLLKRVESGELSGGLFMCERVSRASRQGSLCLLPMIQILLDADFTIQFLEEMESFDRNSVPNFLGTLLAMHADIAFMESKAKSDFSKANWKFRRQLAREERCVFTAECPNWLTVEDGKYVPLQDRVNAIQTIYQLARDGWGISRLVRFANESALPAPGKVGTWHTSLVQRVLTNPALIGRFQPHTKVDGKRVAEGDPIEGYYPTVIDVQLFESVQLMRAAAQDFPKRRDDNNYNYLQGIAKCECGGSIRRMNKNSGAQAGYALYSCSNRVRGTTSCPNVAARIFDFQFVPFACESIPAMLAVGGNPIRDELMKIEAQLKTVDVSKRALLAFIESNQDLDIEVGDRFRALVAERKNLEERRLSLWRQGMPPDSFEFGDVVEVFLPAYLDWFPSDDQQAQDAFRARALFAARVRESVSSVVIASNRESFSVTLKNGLQRKHELVLDIEFKKVEECVDLGDCVEEIEKLTEQRKEGLARVHWMTGATSV